MGWYSTSVDYRESEVDVNPPRWNATAFAGGGINAQIQLRDTPLDQGTSERKAKACSRPMLVAP